MRLTWRDAVGTLVTGMGLAAALAAIQGWGWPLLADARAGVIVLLAISLVVCPVSMGTPSATWYRDPFVLAAAVIGTAILVAGVFGLFGNATPALAWMIVLTFAVWLVTTVHHLVEPLGSKRLASSRPIPQ